MNAKLAVLMSGVVCSVGMAAGEIVVRNAQTNDAADIAARRAEWLADCGVAAPVYSVDFESGYTDGQNVSGIPGLFPGGLVITDTWTTGLAEVRTGRVFGGSYPNGNFALKHNEKPYLEMRFPGAGVSGFALSDIDHSGTTLVVHHSDGTTSTFSIETTTTGGVSGEFVGVWRNGRAPIVRVEMDATGDGTWGIDDIQWVPLCLADLNSDGFVNGDDYDYFASMFEAGEIGADINGDTFVNGDDYDAFASAFEAGC
ncbi:MAG: GC-type dockerin domain-anchored protein [Phycisphaerales bacterium]